jgi:predicted ATPase
MGKTRLLTEFRRRVSGEQVRVCVGQCLSYGQTTPYLPVRALVRQLCGLVEGDAPAKHAAAVEQRLHASGITAADDVALLLHLLDLPEAPDRLTRRSPEARQGRIFSLLRHLVLNVAQHQPLVLVVENLHWSDPTSEAWLTSLVERLSGAAVLLVGSYRPGYQPAWGAHTAAPQVALSPLRASESRAIVQAVPGAMALPEARVQAIVMQAGGNPFFVEELTWDAVEQGSQDRPVAAPETVYAVLAARIDRLPPEAKRLLQTAAIIGLEAPVSQLEALAELPVERLQQSLGQLQAAALLDETQLFPEPVYHFKHALTHEVAYSSLLLERRRELHARLVEVLEGLAPEWVAEQVERLAQHALRGEVWDKAVTYFRQAGDRAAARSASRETVACFEQALAALEHLPAGRARHEQAIDVRFGLCKALNQRLEHGRVLTYLQEAEGLAQALGDQRRLGWGAAYMIDCLQATGDLPRAVEVGQRALTLTGTLGDVRLQVVTHLYLGRAYNALGDYPRAIDLLRQNLVALDGALLRERFGLPGLPSVTSRDILARCLAELGAFTEGLAHGEDSLRIAEAVNHTPSLINACYGIGYVCLRKGEWHRALLWLERGLEVCRVWDVPLLFYLVSSVLGYAYILAGRVSDALPLLEQYVSTEAMQRMRGRVHVWLSEAYLCLGRRDEALAVAVRGLELCRMHAQQGDHAWALRLLGEIYAHRHPPQAEPAEASYREALALAEELGMRPLVAHCHLGLGTLYATTGQPQQARAALSTAVEMYRAMDMPFWLPQTEAALAQLSQEETPAAWGEPLVQS